MILRTYLVLVSLVMVLVSGCLDRKTVKQDAAMDANVDQSSGVAGDSIDDRADLSTDPVSRGSDSDGFSAAGAGGNGDTPGGGGAGGDASLGAAGGRGAGGIGGTGGGGIAGPVDSGTGGSISMGGSGAGGAASGGAPGSGGVLGSGGGTQPDARPSPDLPQDLSPPDAPWGPEAQADAPWGPEAQADAPWGPEAQVDAPGTCASGEKWCAASSSCIGANACCANNDCTGTCKTCNASHACVAAVSQDDPNGRCAGTCDSTGACKSKRGQTCTTVAAGCESGTTCSQDGFCCSSACGQCNSCSTGTCVPLTNGTGCGTGKVCSGGSCENGCWISGGFRASGETSGNCLICNPTKSTTDWSNNDGASVPCGSCGGSATCVNKQLGACSKELVTFWRDGDGDGYGNPLGATTSGCPGSTIAEYAENSGDCNDSDRHIYPGAALCSSDYNNARTCGNNGSWSDTSCPNGCTHGQCKNTTTADIAGQVTCGSVQCPTSQGCSFADESIYDYPPVCGNPYSSTDYALCDGPNDCPSGQVCCARSSSGSSYTFLECVASGSCPYSNPGGFGQVVCSPGQPSCPSGSCSQAWAGFEFGVWLCQ